ncbi:hypothetical protein NDA16_001763 [Ustilago loliicola]|nr:hypothetical protein NDA16_001763 [Ustilago loliicola]
MKCPVVPLIVTICLLGLASQVVAQHRMVKLNPRQNHPYHHPVPAVSEPASANNDNTASAASADPHLSLTTDSDADQSLQHDESMRLFMRQKAESVIASHSGTSFSAYEVDTILSGSAPSLHPGALPNVSWTMDMFEPGAVLPTVSDHSQGPIYGQLQLMSLDSSDGGNNPEAGKEADDRDLNHDGVVSVDELLRTFFHADGVKNIFAQVQAETKQRLDKQGKKDIIKKTAPVLHKTIERVASHRGWGVQDARFAQIHVEDEGEGGKGAFQDYNTFVKTMRYALITPQDAAKDSTKEQEESIRTDPATKA